MSELIVSSFKSEAGHWYTRDGEPMYQVEGANGKIRNTNLRDARKHNLVPSVTTILNVVAKPGLENWKLQQVLLAALTLPRWEKEAESAYIDRIIADSKEQGKAAAEVGTNIHAAIQTHYEGKTPSAYQNYVDGCVRTISKHFNDWEWIAERAFAHELGFGGKCDLHVPASDKHPGLVVDIKTKEFYDPDKVEGYDEHLMQLSAYRVGLGCQRARCANVFVSRNIPGLTKIIEWSEEDLDRGWKMFVRLLEFWQLKNNHK